MNRERLKEELASLRRAKARIVKREREIKAMMAVVWQDNDAPQAEEVTKTSLFCVVDG